jgi:hypothetical protein
LANSFLRAIAAGMGGDDDLAATLRSGLAFRGEKMRQKRTWCL